MSPATSIEGQGNQFFADMNALVRAPITEEAFVPPSKFVHLQPSSKETLLKIINADK